LKHREGHKGTFFSESPNHDQEPTRNGSSFQIHLIRLQTFTRVRAGYQVQRKNAIVKRAQRFVEYERKLVWRRVAGLLRQSNPGVPSDVIVCLRVLARTGRVDCRRPCTSFCFSSGSTAVSILCLARWRSARGMIEWMCTQEQPGSRHHIWRGGALPPGYS
jgi:hypothetical protein